MTPKNVFLIAGPNGSGKSSLSRDLSAEGAVIFDPDKESSKLEDKYPGLPDENLYHALNITLQDAVGDALSHGRDFTIESNLREDQIMETIGRFKAAGYITNIIFIALGTIEESKIRVAQRVKEGGHFVDDYSISYNFNASRKTLFKIAGQFDNVLILESLPDRVNPVLQMSNQEILILQAETDWGEILQQDLLAILMS